MVLISKKLRLSIYFIFFLTIVLNYSYAQNSSYAIKQYSIALITDISGIRDDSYNSLTWKGIVELDKGRFAVNQLDFYQPKRIDDYTPLMREVSEYEGFDIIVAASPYLVKSVREIAREFPEIKYISLGGIIDNRNNVANAEYSVEEGSFVVGVIAAYQTREYGITDIGFIGDIDNYERRRYEAGFIEGVKSVNTNFNVHVAYLNSSTDFFKAQEIAKEMYDVKKISVIYNVSGTAGDGIFKVAKDITKVYNRDENNRIKVEDRKYKYPAWVIGANFDQFSDGIYEIDPLGYRLPKSVTLTSMVFRYDKAIYEIMRIAFDDTFPSGQSIYFSLENDGVGIPDTNSNLSFPFRDNLNKLIDEIIAGTRTVPQIPERITQELFNN